MIELVIIFHKTLFTITIILLNIIKITLSETQKKEKFKCIISYF